MSNVSDDTHQFQIPAGQSDVQSENWTAADAEFVSNNLTGSTILDDQPHDESRWREAMLDETVVHTDPLGLAEAEADVSRRHQEVDFNETSAETLGAEGVAAIEQTAEIGGVLYLRKEFNNDGGMVNGVRAI